MLALYSFHLGYLGVKYMKSAFFVANPDLIAADVHSSGLKLEFRISLDCQSTRINYQQVRGDRQHEHTVVIGTEAVGLIGQSNFLNFHCVFVPDQKFVEA